MLDVVLLAVGLGFFALSVGYTIACDRLEGGLTRFLRRTESPLRQKTLFRRIPVIFDYSLAALVTAGLMIYLTYALLKPERF